MRHQGVGAAVAGLSMVGVFSIASAGGIGTLNPVTYHVSGEHVVGCFAPCMCPIWLAGEVDGTFVRTTVPIPIVFVPPVQVYNISDLAMTLTNPGGTRQDITGSGTYRIFAYPTFQHQMELDLSIGGRDQHFDSGLVPGGGDFPDIDISIALNGSFYCYTSVFSLQASPQPVAVTGDLNQDGIVNSLDLGIMLSDWSIPAIALGCAGDTPCAADLNQDGRVDSLDLGMLLIHWTL